LGERLGEGVRRVLVTPSPNLSPKGERGKKKEELLFQADFRIRFDKWPSAMDGTSGFGGP
jgi:hypothetical protein